jgi:hypothetical protein
MKRRLAAHYIFLGKGKIYKQHYLELGSNDEVEGVYPLENELEKTVFYDGVLFPVAVALGMKPATVFERIKESSELYPDDSVFQWLERCGFVCHEPNVPVHVHCFHPHQCALVYAHTVPNVTKEKEVISR